MCGCAHHACSYNKLREDFDTKEAWDDYLETVEDISECQNIMNMQVLTCVAWALPVCFMPNCASGPRNPNR